jgi:hypothetical protein
LTDNPEQAIIIIIITEPLLLKRPRKPFTFKGGSMSQSVSVLMGGHNVRGAMTHGYFWIALRGVPAPLYEPARDPAPAYGHYLRLSQENGYGHTGLTHAGQALFDRLREHLFMVLSDNPDGTRTDPPHPCDSEGEILILCQVAAPWYDVSFPEKLEAMARTRTALWEVFGGNVTVDQHVSLS